uniref:Uncharacterized protein n=1 Tax=Arundo donax TaxID=35708 RepID=A0A0A9AU93_ARUDO
MSTQRYLGHVCLGCSFSKS